MGPETKFNIHMRPIQKKMVHHTDMWSESKMHKNLEKSSNVPKILAKMKNNLVKRIYVCMRKQTKQLDIFTTKPPTKQLLAQCAKIGKIDFNFLFACVNSNAKISLSQIFHHSIFGFPKLHFFRILGHCEQGQDAFINSELVDQFLKYYLHDSRKRFCKDQVSRTCWISLIMKLKISFFPLQTDN